MPPLHSYPTRRSSDLAPNPRQVGLIGDSQGVNGDDKQVGFVATDAAPGNGNAHVYRVSGNQNGTPIGGYTVVVLDRKSTRLNSSHVSISYAVFCLKKK